MDMFEQTVPQLTKMLTNLKGWLQEARAYADDRGFHPDNYTHARLQLDQFTLTQQIQAACDNAKGIAARLTGKDNPRHEDNETTLDALEARVDRVLAFLATFTEEDFTDAETRLVELPFLKGRGAPATSYLIEFGLPNFYFHCTMAYGILRHSGVKLGKRQFIGGMKIVELPSAE
ncbi:MAG: DUF1993 domain-containing protein [Myxococcota bacterium]